MDALTSAVLARIRNDEEILEDITQYHGRPAVFGVSTWPNTAQLPVIFTYGNVVDVPRDTKNSHGREIARDITVVDNATGDFRRVERMAERVRWLFHRHRLVIPNYGVLVARATGPITGPSDVNLYSRIVTVEWRLSEQ